ncbi:hypothetical protein OHS59_41855 [Streptomyces sp. NBC_00414]|uniref:hypothetical protein n=1 Tax=Streptomyces sp. NBC_00414 TaxID=2975739 RepID=UPI002E20926A
MAEHRAERTRAASPTAGHRPPVTGMLLAALFTLLGVLGLQGIPATASPGTPTPVPVATHHSPAPEHVLAHVLAKAEADTRTGVDDTCTTVCGQPPRAGRSTAGEWHAPPPAGVSVPAGLVVPLPEPGPPQSAAPGAFTPPQHSARHSGRGPPPSTGI